MAPNTPVLLTFRLLAGIFGSSPLAIAGGGVADIWRPHERAIPSSIFASGPWFGPSEQTSSFHLTPSDILTSTSIWTLGWSRPIRFYRHRGFHINLPMHF
jgi:MFS family permease